jgi:hypothetical protein
MTAPENVQPGITGSSDEVMEQFGVPYLPWRQAFQFHNAILLAVDAPRLPVDVDASKPQSYAGEPLSLSAPPAENPRCGLAGLLHNTAGSVYGQLGR